MVLLLSLRLFQAPVMLPRVFPPPSSLRLFQAVTPRLPIRQFNLQQLQFHRMIHLTRSVPFPMQGISFHFIRFPMDLEVLGVDRSSRSQDKLVFTQEFSVLFFFSETKGKSFALPFFSSRGTTDQIYYPLHPKCKPFW